jgi:WD40 repeat protein
MSKRTIAFGVAIGCLTFVLIAMLVFVGWLVLATPRGVGIVFVSSVPAGATIFLNNAEAGQTNAELRVEPGHYTITVQKDRYRKWETEIDIALGETQRLNAILTFAPYAQKLTDKSGYSPAWASDNQTLYIIRVADQLIFLTVDLQQTEHILLRHSPASAEKVVWAVEISAAFVSQSEAETSSVYWLSFIDQRSVFKVMDAFGPTWSPPTRRLVFLQRILDPSKPPIKGYLPATTLVLQAISSGSDNVRTLYRFPENIIPDAIAASRESNELLIESNQGLLIFDLMQTQLRSAGKLQAASNCQWSPNGAQIACVGFDGKNSGFFVVDLKRDAARLLTSEKIKQYQWWPDSSKVVYATPASGQRGASLWTLDVQTGERLLLADSSVLRQNIGNLAVAPDGKRIAFEGEDGNIWVLFLAE